MLLDTVATTGYDSYMNNDAMRTLITNLAAATIMHDQPDLAWWRAASQHERALLIRDYRDEFASSPFDALANARLDIDFMISDVHDLLNRLA